MDQWSYQLKRTITCVKHDTFPSLNSLFANRHSNVCTAKQGSAYLNNCLFKLKEDSSRWNSECTSRICETISLFQGIAMCGAVNIQKNKLRSRYSCLLEKEIARLAP